MKKSIVLLSGGLDSAVNLAEACRKTKVILALTFDYGQRAARSEIGAARKISRYFGIEHQTIKLPWLADITTTALVNPAQKIPRLGKNQLNIRQLTLKTAKQVWVPNRNAVFINIAAAFAESLGAQLIVTGFNAEEGATFPDNSPSFVSAINQTLKWSTLSMPRVISYTQNLNKPSIVKRGIKLKTPLTYIYSCYFAGGKMCGQCESCQRVKRAFQESDHWDLVEARFREK